MENSFQEVDGFQTIPLEVKDKKEFEPGERMVLMYGQHRRKEVVAYEVARRISKFSLLKKNGNMLTVEYPGGADYNDAYDEAKKETENSVPAYGNIREVYHRIFKQKTNGVLEVRNSACELNQGSVVVDIHETTDFSQEDPSLRRNEIVFLNSLTDEQNVELNKRLAEIFPQAEDVNGYKSVLRLVAKGINSENSEREIPRNLVVVELTTRGDDIYEKIASKEGMFGIGRDELNDYLHRKKEDGNPDVGVNREAGIYTRLLEKVLPTVEQYYAEEILSKK